MQDLCTEQWRLLSNGLMLERLSKGKHVGRVEFLASKKVNVNRGDIFLRNHINLTCMLFLSMFTLILLRMCLCAQRNSCPERTE